MNAFIKSTLLSLTLVGFGVSVGVGCAAPSSELDENVNVSTTGEALTSCVPAVVVIRHAEDADEDVGETCVAGEVDLDIGGGKTQRVHQRCLTRPGQSHAELYAKRLGGWMAEKGLCPASRVITQDPYKGVNGVWPSANPFETIRPFVLANALPITFLPSNTIFDDARRRSLLTEPNGSVVIAWDKEGLWEGSSPLLAKLGGPGASFPTRDMVYVFKNMNATTAKFERKEYKQFFQDSSGYFENVTGDAFVPASFYRFADGTLKSKTPGSPDLLPSDMTICGGSSCDGQGITLPESARL